MQNKAEIRSKESSTNFFLIPKIKLRSLEPSRIELNEFEYNWIKMMSNCVFRNSKSWDYDIYLYATLIATVVRSWSKYQVNMTRLRTPLPLQKTSRRIGNCVVGYNPCACIELPLIIVLQRQRGMRRRWRRLAARTFRHNYFDEGRRFLNLN